MKICLDCMNKGLRTKADAVWPGIPLCSACRAACKSRSEAQGHAPSPVESDYARRSALDALDRPAMAGLAAFSRPADATIH
jgi:hypothetical protein